MIGTVPLRDKSFSVLPPINQSEINTHGQLGSIANKTYEECMFSSKINKENKLKFSKEIEQNLPFYPVYKSYSNSN